MNVCKTTSCPICGKDVPVDESCCDNCLCYGVFIFGNELYNTVKPNSLSQIKLIKCRNPEKTYETVQRFRPTPMEELLEKIYSTPSILLEAIPDGIGAFDANYIRGELEKIGDEVIVEKDEISIKGIPIGDRKRKRDIVMQTQKETNPHVPKCPTCGSHNIEQLGPGTRIAAGLMFGLFSKTARSQFHCKDCGYKW